MTGQKYLLYLVYKLVTFDPFFLNNIFTVKIQYMLRSQNDYLNYGAFSFGSKLSPLHFSNPTLPAANNPSSVAIYLRDLSA